MIVVKIELHSARTGYIEEIGRMHIPNITGKGEGRYHKRADYRVQVFRRRSKDARLSVLREGYVRDYPRLSYPVWQLLSRAIEAVFIKEKTT